jgi:adenosylmethionine---8-amino-7-oxononanoate aminotransferase
VQDKATKSPFAWQERRGFRVCELALQKGVWLRPLVNVVAIMPPLSVTVEELDRICTAVEFAIRESIK